MINNENLEKIENPEKQLEKIIKQIQDVNELLKNPEKKEFFISDEKESKKLQAFFIL